MFQSETHKETKGVIYPSLYNIEWHLIVLISKSLTEKVR